MTNKKNKEPNWSKIGVVLAIIFFLIAVGLSIYIFLLAEDLRSPEINWIINNEENLVELKEQIQGIKIIFNGKDILETQEEIKIVNISLVNTGKEIVQTDYEQNLPLGLKFENASIVSYKFIDASGEYLKNGFKVLNQSNQMKDTSHNKFSNEFIIQKIQLDKDSYINFKVYLIQKSYDSLKIQSIGKISGLEKIPIIYQSEATMIQQKSNTTQLIGLSLFIALMIFGLLLGYYNRKREEKKLSLKVDEKLGEWQNDLNIKIIETINVIEKLKLEKSKSLRKDKEDKDISESNDKEM